MTILHSYTGEVRKLLVAIEQNMADLAIADFTDALDAAADDHERMAICRRWRDRFIEVRKLERS